MSDWNVQEPGSNPAFHRPKAKRSEGGMEGERRLVTILFCDVQGSTAMAERLDPEEWTEIMDEAFDYLIAPVVRYQGTVARLMGDGILAVFGAPVAHEDDPQRAILAALDILEGIRPFKEGIQKDYRMDFNVRMGINTGMVVVGEIGSDLAAEWTAMGDAVNLAARLEQTAQPGAIQISEDTYRLVDALFDCEPLGELEIKGRRDPVGVYRVLGVKAQPGRQRGLPGLGSPLIGRERELDQLRQAIEQLRQGRGGIACLIGEAGLGKSRLIEELRAEWRSESGTNNHWLETRGISYNASQPYGLFRQILRQSCGVEEGEPAGVARQKIFENLQAGRGAPSPSTERQRLAVEALMAVDAGSSDPQLEGEELKRQLLLESSEVLRFQAASGPLVVVGDDLHWADPASVDLLVHIFQLCEEAPILYLCALRPYRQVPGWQVKQAAERDYPHRLTQIELQPLDDQQSSALVDGLLAVSALPEPLRRVILSKAEGNPFFVEEIVRELVEEGALARDESGTRWLATREVEEIAIPETIHALLIARIDRLEKEARQTLQLASVIGRNFQYRALEKISGPEVALDRQLNALERMQLIHESARQPEREFTFRHELTRDAAYESILHRRRRQYHRLVGEALESLYPGQLENQAHLLAMHFDKGLERERALKYYTLAGEVAARLYANLEAAGHFSRAIQLAQEAGSPEQLTSLYLQRGRALQNSGQQHAALANYRELEGLGTARADLTMQLAALIPQATLHSIPSDVFDAVESRRLSERTLELARQLGDHAAEARSLWNMMLMEVMGGGIVERAGAYGEQALGIARQHGLAEEQAYILHDLVRVYIHNGRAREAQAAHEEVKQYWTRLGNKAMLADSLGAISEGYLELGEFQRAFETGQEGLAVAREIDNPWGKAYNQMILTAIYFETGEIGQARRAAQESIRFGKESDFIGAQAYAQTLLSWIYGIFGDPQRAAQIAQESDLLDKPGAGLWRIMARMGQAYIHLLNGDREQANQLIADLEQSGSLHNIDLFFSPVMYLLLGELALANDRPEEALAHAEKWARRKEPFGLRYLLPDLYRFKGLALVRQGNLEEGIQALEKARRLAEETGARRALWPALLALEEVYRQQGEQEKSQAARQQLRELAQFFLSHIEDQDLQGKFEALQRRLLEANH